PSRTLGRHMASDRSTFAWPVPTRRLGRAHKHLAALRDRLVGRIGVPLGSMILAMTAAASVGVNALYRMGTRRMIALLSIRVTLAPRPPHLAIRRLDVSRKIRRIHQRRPFHPLPQGRMQIA